jgi:hypothetical protein
MSEKIIGIVFLILYIIFVSLLGFWKSKRTLSKPVPGDLFVNKTKGSTSVVVKSLRTTTGSAVVNCDSKGVKVRLSRGGRFSGIVNGKRIELEGPKDKDWEEFYIKT